jgi:glycosyltransferase involved in cell wall biosynthesis
MNVQDQKNALKFSVIITLYNKEPYIDRALRSVLTQNKMPHQIIIVDDCSTDGSVKTAKKSLDTFGKTIENVDIQFIQHQTNGGPSVARNSALKILSGDYVFLLDADDELHPGLFFKAAHLFKTYDISLLFYQFERDIGGRVLPVLEGLGEVIEPLEENIYLIPNTIAAFGHNSFGMNGSSVASRCSTLKGHFYKENLSCFEGLDFWYRVARSMQKGGRSALLTGIQVTIHLVENSVSRKLVNNGGEIYIPCQFSQFKHSKDLDDQRLRRRIYTIWIRNAHLKIPKVAHRLRFYWQYRSEIFSNLILNYLYR